MSTPAKIVNVDQDGYSLVTAVANVAIANKQFEIDDDTAVLLRSGKSGLDRKKILIKSRSSDDVTVFLGSDDDVTTTDGWPLYPDDEVELDLDDSAEVWAVADPGTGESATVYILELE